MFESLKQEMLPRYPRFEVKRTVEGTVRLGDAGVTAAARDVGFHGLVLHEAEKRFIVQLRPDGFTVNQVAQYSTAEALMAEALRTWPGYVAAAQVEKVIRLAFRYINKFPIPIENGQEFSTYLAAGPTLPGELPQGVSNFLMRAVIQDRPSAPRVIVTQKITAGRDAEMPQIIIDVDAVAEGQFKPTVDGIRPVLDELRELKNRVFFGLLTDAAVRLFE